jgi:hypothetical protein
MQFKILGLIRNEHEELQRLVRDSPLPMLVSHWLKNREDANYLEAAGLVLSKWDADHPTRPASTPARLSSPGPPLPTIVVRKSSAKAPIQHKDVRTDAAAAVAAHRNEARQSPPRIPSALKGKGRLVESGEGEQGTRTRQKKFREIEEEDDSDDGDVSPGPQKPAGPSRKPPATPVRRRKAGGNKRRPGIPTGERHDPACGNCERAEAECLKDQGGGACIRCMKQKHRCDYSRARRSRREKKDVGSEVDEVSDNNKYRGHLVIVEYSWKVKRRKSRYCREVPHVKGPGYLSALRQ